MANRLAHETSPYLLQHADNPVDWYPWGEEALRAPREAGQADPALDRLLRLPLVPRHGARESFEDPEIAALMNELFVNIKVDREERPDLDSLYMQPVQAMTGHGGWPMTVFLTPEGEPFYGGTYFPPEDRGGCPASRGSCAASPRPTASGASGDRRQRRATSPSTWQTHFSAGAGRGGARRRRCWTKPPSALAAAVRPGQRRLRRRAEVPPADGARLPAAPCTRALGDPPRAGDGRTDAGQDGARRHLRPARRRLPPLRRRAVWLVPHFEKMLYDNAQLAQHLPARLAGDRRAVLPPVAEETLDYVLREMTRPDGGFYSTQDADSEGDEGKFFVWTPDELDGGARPGRRCAGSRLSRCDNARQLRGLQRALDPRATRPDGLARRAIRDAPPTPVRRARQSHLARPRREDSHLLEWPDVARVRYGGLVLR